MKTLIIDDEQRTREYLRHLLLQHFPWLTLSGEASTVSEAIQLIGALKPDLLLLDIKLGQETAFDLLQALGEYRCLVIFITGYNEYAVKAFEVAAIHYLLKPVELSALAKALDKAREQHELLAVKPMVGGLAHLMKEMQKSSSYIALPHRNGRLRVPVAHIEYCFSINGCVEVQLNNGEKLLVSRDFPEIQAMLEPYDFFRCHQSYLVNADYVKASKKVDGKTFLLMNIGKLVPVARSNVTWVKLRLNL
jgi:two-component system, LytTR family, response regulator